VNTIITFGFDKMLGILCRAEKPSASGGGFSPIHLVSLAKIFFFVILG
jgi:hypothetical protein